MDFDFFVGRADCHFDVDRDAATDFKYVSGFGVGFKSRCSYLQRVRSNIDVGEDVGAFAIADGGALDVRRFFDEGDLGVGNCGAGGVGDVSLDASGSSDLRGEGAGGEQEKRER